MLWEFSSYDHTSWQYMSQYFISPLPMIVYNCVTYTYMCPSLKDFCIALIYDSTKKLSKCLRLFLKHVFSSFFVFLQKIIWSHPHIPPHTSLLRKVDDFDLTHTFWTSSSLSSLKWVSSSSSLPSSIATRISYVLTFLLYHLFIANLAQFMATSHFFATNPLANAQET